MLRLHQSPLVVTAILCLAAASTAQDDRNKPQARPVDAGTTAASQNDHILAQCLIVDNENEIALAELAKQRASSDEVKQFATRMITDHQQMISKLSSFTSGAMPTERSGHDTDRPGERTGADKQNPSDRNPTGQNPTDRNPTGQNPTGQNPTGQNPPSHDANMRDHDTMMHGTKDTLDLVSLKRELGRKCLESAKKELMSKTGAEFDRCYMGQQIGAHMMVADELEVFRNYASEKFRQGLTDALPTVQEHLQHAKSIAEKLEGAAARPSK
jgi:predicted outer membrane protein